TFFSSMFGPYPYDRLSAAYSTNHLGEGFSSLLLLQNTGVDKDVSGMAHSAAHQWWGGLVGWRSYRDQWLSDGFAEYSRLLYAGAKLKPRYSRESIKDMRFQLTRLTPTDTGTSKQKLFEVGPLTLGGRLSSRRSGGGSSLNYTKGALVLRMIHYLF